MAVPCLGKPTEKIGVNSGGQPLWSRTSGGHRQKPKVRETKTSSLNCWRTKKIYVAGGEEGCDDNEYMFI